MNIIINQQKSLWKTITEWFRGNSRITKYGEYQLYKSKPSTITIVERGDILTGHFKHPETGVIVFGNAIYLGESKTPNYKLLNTVNTQL